MKKKFLTFFAFLSFFFFPRFASAHEAYVLTRQEFQQGLMQTTSNPLGPLFMPSYRMITLFITLCVIISYICVVLWSTTSWAGVLDKVIKRAKSVGPLIIRISIAASFFYAAQANAILGPELSLTAMAGGDVIRFLLFVLALAILLGLFTEVAGFIGLCLFCYTTYYAKDYMITYANYLGELLVLCLFGSRFLSLDLLFFGKKLWFSGLEKWKTIEVPLVRVLYGIALMYAGWNIKFSHQEISVWVYNQYHLNNFFHASAGYIAAGAGVAEIIIGLFILFGITMRFTLLISLFFITLSIFYFREMLWPHFMLYGISFSLFINSADQFSIDRYMVPWARNIRKKLFHR